MLIISTFENDIFLIVSSSSNWCEEVGVYSDIITFRFGFKKTRQLVPYGVWGMGSRKQLLSCRVYGWRRISCGNTYNL